MILLARMLCFGLGIDSFLLLSTFPTIHLLWLFPFSLLLCRYRLFFQLILFFLIGFCWTWYRLDSAIINDIPKNLLTDDVTVTGVVSSLPEKYDDQLRFQIKSLSFETQEEIIKRDDITLRLSWYRPDSILKPGQVWSMRVRLKEPYGFMNPGGFDYEFWMLRQGIDLSGYVVNSSQNRLIDERSQYLLQKTRYFLFDKLIEQVDDSIKGVVLALTLGERSYLNNEQWNILLKTGTNHLFAISGLHLVLISGVIYFFARLLVSQFEFIILRFPAPIIASIISFFSACFYAALAGFSLPTQRALIMIFAVLYTRLDGRKFISSQILAIAVGVILIIDPLALMAVDFWLSFSAVCLILFVSSYRNNPEFKFLRYLRVQFGLSLGLLPLIAFYFQQIPLLTFIANLLVIPIMGMVVIPLLLSGLILLLINTSIATYIYSIVEILNSIFWSMLNWLAHFDFSTLILSVHTVLPVVFGVLGILILFLPKGFPLKHLGVIFLLPLLFPWQTKLDKGDFDVTMLDVGQGLAVVVKTSSHVLVYDTGARFSKRFNAGDAVLIPYLKYQGIRKIDTLVISHGDNDHIGGAESLLEQFPVSQIISSVADKFVKNKADWCVSGGSWDWDGVNFNILHPDKAFLNKQDNNASCVIKITSPEGSILLTGDIERLAEQQLISVNPDKLKADVLLIPHHGSMTSTSQQFLNRVDPEIALVSAGFRNRFGFPKQAIMERLKKQNIQTLVSYVSGAVTIKFRQSGREIEEYRSQQQRIWREQP